MSVKSEEKKKHKLRLYVYRTVIISIIVLMMVLSLLQF